jgi:pyruvate kinase
MKNRTQKLEKLENKFDEIITRLKDFERRYENELEKIDSNYRSSAINLVHYLAFRSFDIAALQDELRELSLPSLSNIEPHVMSSLLSIKMIIEKLNDKESRKSKKGYVTIKKSKKIINNNTKQLLGNKSKKRRTRIMVTLPNTAAEDASIVHKLLKSGMNCARINCAHDDKEAWAKMINNVREASARLNKSCKIMMDLGGPKLRTGQMTPGAEVIHIKPERDEYGKVVTPSKIWIAPPDVPPRDDSADALLPVDEIFFRKIKRGNTISFVDSRDKKCKIVIEKKQGEGKWGACSDSAYVQSGTELELVKSKGDKEKIRVGKLLPLEKFIVLKNNDKLLLTSDPAHGEDAKYDETGKLTQHAHVSCTLPEIFNDLQVGEPIFFDDGKIEGIIENVNDKELDVKITYAKDTGSKLKADKGINLPKSDIKISGLTQKDKADMEFVLDYSDSVNFSFVNDENDVAELHNLFMEKQKSVGIILKIETEKGFKNLPRILLRAMRNYPIGVMIARGDLAVETGWKNFASIQEEIMRICEAAHIPDIWATQVLENLAKKGVPTRSEITDSALAQRAECVMLNKGYYITKAVKMLDKILRRMQYFQKKKELMLPKLQGADKLVLSHEMYDIN